MNPEVDAYIRSLDAPWKQEIMRTLRDCVHEADPEITEAIKWGAPAFEHSGPVAWMFAATEWAHFSFPQGALLDQSHGQFEEGPETEKKGKRTLKFRADDTIPVDLVIRLTRQAVQNNLKGKRVSFGVAKPGVRTFDLPHEYEVWLTEHGLLAEYRERPYYQQKGWIQWIESAKREQTKSRRRDTMLGELRDGTYMPPKNSSGQ